MAVDKKTSELAPATALAAADYAMVIQGGVNTQAPASLYQTFVNKRPIKGIASGYTVLLGDENFVLQSTAGVINGVAFPTAANFKSGTILTLKADDFEMQINPFLGDLVENVPNGDFFCIPANGAASFVSDGSTKWYIVWDSGFRNVSALTELGSAVDINVKGKFSVAYISSTVDTVDFILDVVGLYQNERFIAGDTAVIINRGAFDIPLQNNGLATIGTVKANTSVLLACLTVPAAAGSGTWKVIPLDDGGASSLEVVNTAVAYPVTVADLEKVILCSAALVVTFPKIVAPITDGFNVYVKNNSAVNVTLTPALGETFDGVAGNKVLKPQESVKMMANAATNWSIISEKQDDAASNKSIFYGANQLDISGSDGADRRTFPASTNTTIYYPAGQDKACRLEIRVPLDYDESAGNSLNFAMIFSPETASTGKTTSLQFQRTNYNPGTGDTIGGVPTTSADTSAVPEIANEVKSSASFSFTSPGILAGEYLSLKFARLGTDGGNDTYADGIQLSGILFTY